MGFSKIIEGYLNLIYFFLVCYVSSVKPHSDWQVSVTSDLHQKMCVNSVSCASLMAPETCTRNLRQ